MKSHSTLMLSFEFFPPKTQEGVASLVTAARSLAKYHPNFMSVTFGAGGSTRSGTIETVGMLQSETGISIAPHLSCIGSTTEEIVDILDHYQSMGVRRLVALRGDMPSGMVNSGTFHYASELVDLIRRETGDYFHIEVAAYPNFIRRHVRLQTMCKTSSANRMLAQIVRSRSISLIPMLIFIIWMSVRLPI